MRHEIKPVPEGNKQVLSAISQVPIFDKLDGDEIKILIRNLGYFKAKEGDIIFEEGEEGTHVCFVVSGTLDVLKKVEGDEQVVITSVRQGRSVGEMAIIDKLTRSATIRARTETNVLVMSAKQFNYILGTYPGMGIKILKGLAIMLSGNLRKTATRLADYMLPMG